MRGQRWHARPWRRRLRASSKLIFVGTALIATSGCSQTVTGTTAQMCQDWREIGVRKADKITDDTAREIVGNNEARAAWCNAKRAGA